MTPSAVIRPHAVANVAGKKVPYTISNPATLMGFQVGVLGDEVTGQFFDPMKAG